MIKCYYLCRIKKLYRQTQVLLIELIKTWGKDVMLTPDITAVEFLKNFDRNYLNHLTTIANMAELKAEYNNLLTLKKDLQRFNKLNP